MDKKLPFIASFLIALLFNSGAFSQCTIDSSYTKVGIFPDTLPDGMVSHPYSKDITFVMPKDTQSYNFTNFHIVSVSLPIGLNWKCDHYSNGCNYDPQVSIYGCVNINGTPLLAGTYTIAVNVIADLTIVQGIPVTFNIFMKVLSDTSTVSNSGFTMTGSSTCMPALVSFTNNNPGLIKYHWDFGNGSFSNQENPGPQFYNTPGTYIVQYQAWSDTTTYHFYNMTNIAVTNINCAWSWGCPTEANPDPYVKVLENGSTIYQSSAGSDVWTGNWNMNLSVIPANTYKIEVWDDDQPYSGDDLIGTYNLPNLNGCTGCAAGSDAIINYTINHTVIPPTPSITVYDTVYVYPYPGKPNTNYDSLNYVLSTDSSSYFLQWYYMGSPIPGAIYPTDTATMSGYYWVVAVNSHGCATQSDSVKVVICNPTFVPNISSNGMNLWTKDSSSIYTFQWYNQSGPVTGATHPNYPAAVSGSYYVILTDPWGCVYQSPPKTLVTGVSEDEDKNSLSIFPNPSSTGIFNVLFSKPISEKIRTTVYDMIGNEIYSDDKFLCENKTSCKIDLTSAKKGIYFLNVKTAQQSSNYKIVIN